MTISKDIVKAAQHASWLDDSEIDGLVGPITIAAAREYDTECDDFDIPFNQEQKLVVYVAQHASGLRGSDVDGVVGPITREAVAKYLKKNNIEVKTTTKSPRKSKWAVWQPHKNPGIFVVDNIDLKDGTIIKLSGGLDPIPKREQRDGIFGDAKGLGEHGMKKRLTTITGLPGRFNKGTGTLPQVHEKVMPHIKLAFDLWEKFGVLDEIYKIWFFVFRHMRHDPSRPLSLHSWGIACDINSKENYAWSPKGDQKEIQPFSVEWCQKYPKGLSEIAVLCMKKAGFRWGGDWSSYRDPMHFELQSR